MPDPPDPAKERNHLLDFAIADCASCFPRCEERPEEIEKVAEFPDMRGRKKVTLGPRSGVFVLGYEKRQT